MDFSQYTKPTVLRHMFIGVGVGFIVASVIPGVASILLGIIVVVLGVVGETLMGGKRQPPTTTPPRV